MSTRPASIQQSTESPNEISQEKEIKVIQIGNAEKAMAPHSSTVAWKIPWTEEPGRLQFMESLRVGHS